jgi:hypothetical protein
MITEPSRAPLHPDSTLWLSVRALCQLARCLRAPCQHARCLRALCQHARCLRAPRQLARWLRALCQLVLCLRGLRLLGPCLRALFVGAVLAGLAMAGAPPAGASAGGREPQVVSAGGEPAGSALGEGVQTRGVKIVLAANPSPPSPSGGLTSDPATGAPPSAGWTRTPAVPVPGNSADPPATTSGATTGPATSGGAPASPGESDMPPASTGVPPPTSGEDRPDGSTGLRTGNPSPSTVDHSRREPVADDELRPGESVEEPTPVPEPSASGRAVAPLRPTPQDAEPAGAYQDTLVYSGVAGLVIAAVGLTVVGVRRRRW